MTGADPITWNATIAGLPGAHILQTHEWAQFKAGYGWKPLPQVWRDERATVQAAAMVLERSLRFGGFSALVRVLYVPRGPLLDWNDAALRGRVLQDLEALARQRRAIFIKIDPEVILGKGIPGEAQATTLPGGLESLTLLEKRGWLFSEEQVQFRNTVLIDLSGSESDWLARMKPKTRYNLRLAERKGVTVRRAAPEDLQLLYRLYAETSIRDGFVIRPEAYYRDLWQRYLRAGMAEALIAEVEGEPIAGLILFFFSGRAWYLYGMSRNVHREKMPNYPLQWEAMRAAKMRGCHLYDLWGAPDTFDETDPMWGVFRFKSGLGGEVIRMVGAWDYPVNRMVYAGYTRLLPRILNWMRRRGKQQTRQEAGL
ncbi:MAG: peptidoglycan bridge formation glycyltransferase FemA/FemB family protein [Chloroflexota bacterium]|jgi:lipid II:glycine glycyltransferase (peptidoglycan interpeptide bridge formation enzyme)